MNAKLAKRLRGEARVATTGMPQVRYVAPVRWGGTISLHPKCTRAIYRKLKARAASPMTFERHVENVRHARALAALEARRQRRRRAAARRRPA